MTDEQINAAIHAALGNPIGCPRCSDPQCAYNKGFNYCEDLNAMVEAERTIGTNRIIFLQNLAKICNYPLPSKLTKKWFWICDATARQRAEALLRTLGKWEEVQG